MKKVCIKCKTADATVLIRHALYCQECFLYAFAGKYRLILSKSNAMRSNRGKVLLACSGGPSSIAMLNLTKDFMHVDPAAKKKKSLIPSAIVYHIDESALFNEQVQYLCGSHADLNSSSNDKAGSTSKLKTMVETKYPNMEFLAHPMENIFDPRFIQGSDIDKYLKPTGDSEDYELLVQMLKRSSISAGERSKLLSDLFRQIKKDTAKESLYWHIKMTMFLAVAEREGCSCIFFADSSTRQCIKIISMTSKGRGFSIPLDVGVEAETGVKGLSVLRPMKDMLSKEIGFYNRFQGLSDDVIAPINFHTQANAKSSIERLTEDFIVALDKEFPSTVSTVSRTASKLTPSKEMDFSKGCAICQMYVYQMQSRVRCSINARFSVRPYQSGLEDWRRRITVTDVKETEKEDGCCGGSKCGSGCASSNHGQLVDLNLSICYSCQVDLKDYSDQAIELLPPYVAQGIDHAKMRSQIEDYLLSDDEDDQ
ncbi:hypothetical protein BCR43DRAFT_544839 [Syncephalastrum racemosum]|uniref:Cytoplasmic tRNA 2-thiolation protein 2 n=1 Tax=Syncephalastrum racemosum TaxID=13706 RepID=A0A1X2HJS3_SYNRA|nr:hypothetical protein BCR43DRAFT_544839 [Syncephalastrum racemosum]